MNPLTHEFLERLWDASPTFKTIEERLKSECRSLSPVKAAVIGRDLIRRRSALYTKDFHLAAFLASGGVAGNDGFSDFADCVAVLPENRYQRILDNPDELISDPVSMEFDEFHLISKVSKVFDQAFRDEDGGLLAYFVSDDSKINWTEIHSGTENDAKEHLPRLYAKYGHLMKDRTQTVIERNGDTVGLDDLIPKSELPGNH